MTKFSTLSAKFSTPGVLIPRTGARKIPRPRRQIADYIRGGQLGRPNLTPSPNRPTLDSVM